MKKEKMTRYTLMLPRSLIKNLDNLVKKHRSTRSYLMRLFIFRGVEEEKSKIKLDNQSECL